MRFIAPQACVSLSGQTLMTGRRDGSAAARGQRVLSQEPDCATAAVSLGNSSVSQ
jgi:hypothetical protein